MKTHEAMNYFLKVVCQTEDRAPSSIGLTNERALKKIQSLYEGHGRGAELQAAKDTAWGLLCAVTRVRGPREAGAQRDNRLDSAWFGQGALLKQRALDQALQLVS